MRLLSLSRCQCHLPAHPVSVVLDGLPLGAMGYPGGGLGHPVGEGVGGASAVKELGSEAADHSQLWEV